MKTFDELSDYALFKRGAWFDYPFGTESLFIKVLTHYFVSFAELKGERIMTVRCRAEDGARDRTRYPASVTRGYHCPPVQQPTNNTVYLDRGEVSDEELFNMIDRAYDFVVDKFTRKEREAFENGNAEKKE